MIGHDRAIVGRRRVPLFAVVCVPLILALSACSGLRQAIGIDRTAPDEFAVESRAPLTIPPDFSLRPPEPGAPRPHEVTAAERAQKVIDAAGPGAPGKQETAVLQAPAAGIGGAAPDASQQVGPNSLAGKLLGSTDTASGAAVDKRETSPLKGVH